MKAIKFMLSACVAAVALTSCEKEDIVPQVQNTNMKSVEISLDNARFSATRGDAGAKINSGDAVVVNDFKVFLVDNAGNEYKAKVSDGSADAKTYWSKEDLAANAVGDASFHYVDHGCVKVVAVANLGADMTYAQFLQLGNINVNNEQNQADLSLYAEAPLVKSNEAHQDENVDGTTYVSDLYTANLTLKPRISRFEVDGFRVVFNDDPKYDEILVTDILFDHYAEATSLATGVEAATHIKHIENYDVQSTVFNWFNDASKATGWWWDSFATPLVITPDAPAADVENAAGEKTPLAYHFFSGTIVPNLVIKLVADGYPAYVHSTGFYSAEKKIDGQPARIDTFEEGYIYRMSAAGEVAGSNGSIPIPEDVIDPMDRCLEITLDVVEWTVELIYPEF
jgi:hypothetical protein